MDRKEFLTRSMQFGFCCGTLALLGGTAAASGEDGEKEEGRSARDEFIAVWVQSFMETLDSGLDRETRIDLMVANGRACARRGALRYAKEHIGDLDSFLGWFNQVLGEGAAMRQGQDVTLTWDRCECPVVKDAPERLSDTYCNCSAGWVQEMFATVTGNPVTVDILETVKRGGDRCRIAVRV